MIPAKKHLAIAMVLLWAVAASAAPKKVQRSSVIRKGSGPYFEVVASVSAGTTLDAGKQNGKWVPVKYEGQDGWIAEKAFVKPKPGLDYSGMLSDPGFKKVRSIDIAAATKGAFLTSYSSEHKIDVEIAVKVDTTPIRKDLVVSIRDNLSISDPVRTVGRLPRQKFRNTIVMNLEAEGAFGQTLLSRLVSAGIVSDGQLVAYLNAVAQVVAAQSQRYDVPFKIAILDDETINGFGLPGGYILLSMGLLKAMDDEAELACMLGHEIAHVALYHGLREFDARSLHRRAASAFDELDMELGEQKSDIEEDLNTLADEAYLKIIGRRARGDEMEADAYGVAYAASAGYDPEAMIRLLKRIGNTYGTRKDTFRHHPTINERISALKKLISKYNLDRKDQVTLAERFAANVR